MRASRRRKEGGRGKKKEEGGSREERGGREGRGRKERHRRQWTTGGKRNRDVLFSREISPSCGKDLKSQLYTQTGTKSYPTEQKIFTSVFFLSIPTTATVVSNRVSQPQHCWHSSWIILRWKGRAWALHEVLQHPWPLATKCQEPSALAVTTQHTSRYCQESHGGKEGNRSPQVWITSLERCHITSPLWSLRILSSFWVLLFHHRLLKATRRILAEPHFEGITPLFRST